MGLLLMLLWRMCRRWKVKRDYQLLVREYLENLFQEDLKVLKYFRWKVKHDTHLGISWKFILRRSEKKSKIEIFSVEGQTCYPTFCLGLSWNIYLDISSRRVEKIPIFLGREFIYRIFKKIWKEIFGGRSNMITATSTS